MNGFILPKGLTCVKFVIKGWPRMPASLNINKHIHTGCKPYVGNLSNREISMFKHRRTAAESWTACRYPFTTYTWRSSLENATVWETKNIFRIICDTTHWCDHHFRGCDNLKNTEYPPNHMWQCILMWPTLCMCSTRTSSSGVTCLSKSCHNIHLRINRRECRKVLNFLYDIRVPWWGGWWTLLRWHTHM